MDGATRPKCQRDAQMLSNITFLLKFLSFIFAVLLSIAVHFIALRLGRTNYASALPVAISLFGTNDHNRPQATK